MLEPQTPTKLAELPDIRLGWVKRFYSAARRHNLAAAGVECAVHPTTLSDSVQRLGTALRLPLLIPATALQPVLGKAFIIRAEKILKLAESIKEPFNDVTVAGLQALIAASENDTYIGAAKALGWTRDKMMRGIANIEDWLGMSVVSSTGRGIRLNGNGLRVLPVAVEIVAILEAARGKCDDPRYWVTKRRKKPWWLRTYGAGQAGVR